MTPLARRTARITGVLAALVAVVLGTALPASASTNVPPGYVLGTVEWCNWTAYKFADYPLSNGQGSIHLRARATMSGSKDGVCAYVTDDATGSHWINVRVKASGWDSQAWDGGTYSTYAGAIGVAALPCFDLVYGETTVDGAKHSATFPIAWCV